MFVNELREWLNRYPPDAIVALDQPTLCESCTDGTAPGVVHISEARPNEFKPQFEPDVQKRLEIERAEAALARAKG